MPEEDKQSHSDQKESMGNKGSLSDVFATFIRIIDYFNYEKSDDGSINYWVSGRSKDIISFELGGYLLSRIDYWLFAHDNQHRNEIMEHVTGNFLKIFSDLLNMPLTKLNSTLNNRLYLYGQLKKETHHGTKEFSQKDYEKYYSIISDVFLNSKNEDKIIEFSSIDKIPCILNIIDVHKLRMRIIFFEINVLKTLFEQIGAVNFENQRNS